MARGGGDGVSDNTALELEIERGTGFEVATAQEGCSVPWAAWLVDEDGCEIGKTEGHGQTEREALEALAEWHHVKVSA